MELIDIIYNVLIFGVGLLLVVVASSYILSRNKGLDRGNNINPKPKYKVTENPVPLKQAADSTAAKHIYNRNSTKTNSQPYPKIFPLDQYIPKEVKVVRRQTFSKDFIHSELNTEKLRNATKSTGNGFRYTIINENVSYSDDSKVVQSY
jgi:hypothetical protein